MTEPVQTQNRQLATVIAGMRDFTDYNALLAAVESCPWRIGDVISGGAKGVDAMGERWAKDSGRNLIVIPADWDAHGRAAGPIRNARMAREGEGLIALWDGQSKGTASMIREARKAGIRLHIHRTDWNHD